MRSTIIAAAAVGLLLAGCSQRGPKLPSAFELIASTSSNGQRLRVWRDTGTGCEWITTYEGRAMQPRNERGSDGDVKQRCVTDR